MLVFLLIFSDDTKSLAPSFSFCSWAKSRQYQLIFVLLNCEAIAKKVTRHLQSFLSTNLSKVTEFHSVRWIQGRVKIKSILNQHQVNVELIFKWKLQTRFTISYFDPKHTLAGFKAWVFHFGWTSLLKSWLWKMIQLKQMKISGWCDASGAWL